MKARSLFMALYLSTFLVSCFGGKKGETSSEVNVLCNPEITTGICKGKGDVYTPFFKPIHLEISSGSTKNSRMSAVMSRNFVRPLSSLSNSSEKASTALGDYDISSKAQNISLVPSEVSSLTFRYYAYDSSLFNSDSSELLVRIYRTRNKKVEVLQNFLLENSEQSSRSLRSTMVKIPLRANTRDTRMASRIAPLALKTLSAVPLSVSPSQRSLNTTLDSSESETQTPFPGIQTQTDPLSITDIKDGDTYSAQVYRAYTDDSGNALYHYYNQLAVITTSIDNTPICDPNQNPDGCTDPGGDYDNFRSIHEEVSGSANTRSLSQSFRETSPVSRGLKANGILKDFDIDSSAQSVTVNSNETKSLPLRYYPPSGSTVFGTNTSDILVRIFRIRSSQKTTLATITLKKSDGQTGANYSVKDFQDGDKYTAQLYRQVNNRWRYYDQKAVLTVKVGNAPVCDPNQNPDGCTDPGGDYSNFRTINEEVSGSASSKSFGATSPVSRTLKDNGILKDFDIDGSAQSVTVNPNETKSLPLRYYPPSGSAVFGTNTSDILVRIFRIRSSQKQTLSTITLKKSGGQTGASYIVKDFQDGDKYTAQLYRQVDGTWNYYDQKAILTVNTDNTPVCDPNQNPDGCTDPGGDYSNFRTINEEVSGSASSKSFGATSPVSRALKDNGILKDFDIDSGAQSVSVNSNETKSLLLRYYPPSGSTVFDTNVSDILIRIFRIRSSQKQTLSTITARKTDGQTGVTYTVKDFQDGDKFTAQLYRQVNSVWNYYDQKAILTVNVSTSPICDPTTSQNLCNNGGDDYTPFKNFTMDVSSNAGKKRSIVKTGFLKAGAGGVIDSFDVDDSPRTDTVPGYSTKLTMKYYHSSGNDPFASNSSDITVRFYRTRGGNYSFIKDLTLTSSNYTSGQTVDMTDYQKGDKYAAQFYRKLNGTWVYYDQKAIVTLDVAEDGDDDPPTPCSPDDAVPCTDPIDPPWDPYFNNVIMEVSLSDGTCELGFGGGSVQKNPLLQDDPFSINVDYQRSQWCIYIDYKDAGGLFANGYSTPVTVNLWRMRPKEQNRKTLVTQASLTSGGPAQFVLSIRCQDNFDDANAFEDTDQFFAQVFRQGKSGWHYYPQKSVMTIHLVSAQPGQCGA